MKAIEGRVFLDEIDDISVGHPSGYHTEWKQFGGYPKKWKDIWMRKPLPNEHFLVKPLTNNEKLHH
jgi:hypothetical protein